LRILEEGLPRKLRRKFLQFVGSHWIVDRDRVPLLRFRPTGFSDFSLEIDDLTSAPLRLRPPEQTQNGGDVILIRLLRSGEVRLEIVIAVGQPEPALSYVEGIMLRVFQIQVNSVEKQ